MIGNSAILDHEPALAVRPAPNTRVRAVRDPQPVVAVRSVSKTYLRGETPVAALSDVSLEVERGAFSVLCGPSGSGKSSLLNIIGLLDTPDAGGIELAGEQIDYANAAQLEQIRREKLGFVFQNFNLVPVLSALENVELPLYTSPMSARQRRERSAELLQAVGLGERMAHRPHQLSGGQQQRVAVARSLVTDPVLVLADEPTANLDSASTAMLIDLMRRLNAERGTAFLFATHDPRVIERANRVYSLVDGALVQ